MNFEKVVPLRLSKGKYRKLSQSVYERDKFCQFCGKHNSLTTAHIIRRSQGGEDTMENTMAACIICHADFDQYKIELPEKVWRRMSIEHREAYVKTRRTIREEI